jgi:hypothetical protein
VRIRRLCVSNGNTKRTGRFWQHVPHKQRQTSKSCRRRLPPRIFAPSGNMIGSQIALQASGCEEVEYPKVDTACDCWYPQRSRWIVWSSRHEYSRRDHMIDQKSQRTIWIKTQRTQHVDEELSRMLNAIHAVATMPSDNECVPSDSTQRIRSR